MATVALEQGAAPAVCALHCHLRTTSTAISEVVIFEDLGGGRYDASLGHGPPSVLLTVLTHESDPVEVKRMANELMHGVASVVGEACVTIKAQFHGDHTSNSATVVLTPSVTNTTTSAQTELSGALLCAYKRTLRSAHNPVFPRLIHDVLFLPSGRMVRYEGRVEGARDTEQE